MSKISKALALLFLLYIPLLDTALYYLFNPRIESSLFILAFIAVFTIAVFFYHILLGVAVLIDDRRE